MKSLNGAQRRFLKSLAHHLKPVVQIGKSGISDALVESVSQALDSHELIKIRFTDQKDQKKQFTADIVKRTGSHSVAILGNISILYRQNSDSEKRKVDLPA